MGRTVHGRDGGRRRDDGAAPASRREPGSAGGLDDLGDPAEHLVEGRRKPADLVLRPGLRETLGQGPSPDTASAADERIDRTERAAGEPEADHDHRGENGGAGGDDDEAGHAQERPLGRQAGADLNRITEGAAYLDR
jgi:hypothetical protein